MEDASDSAAVLSVNAHAELKTSVSVENTVGRLIPLQDL